MKCNNNHKLEEVDLIPDQQLTLTNPNRREQYKGAEEIKVGG